MKLLDLGESALIDRFVNLHSLPSCGDELVVGIGDDAAVLSSPANRLTIVTTDLLAENSDFLLDKTTPRQLGWKSIATNISDVAAMAGLPTWTLVSLGLRKDIDIAWVDELYAGMAECARAYGSTIVGGDTNSVEGDIVISVSQLGIVEPECLKLRSGARPGDRILVTGNLGESIAGLRLLIEKNLDEASKVCPKLVQAHLAPTPRVFEARTAVISGSVHSLMDISDGLAADLPKLCHASKVGAVVWESSLPVSDDLQIAAELLGASAAELAAQGGEDFELLMTVALDSADTIKSAIEVNTGTPVTDIGVIVEGSTVLIEDTNGLRKPLSGGWEHFRANG